MKEEDSLSTRIIGADYVVARNLKYELKTPPDSTFVKNGKKVTAQKLTDSIAILPGRISKDTDNPGFLDFKGTGHFEFNPDKDFFGDIIFQYYIIPDKNLTGQEERKFGPYTVDIVVEEIADEDGIPTIIEELFSTNDIDDDGVPDRKADHIVALPMRSAKEFNSAIELSLIHI